MAGPVETTGRPDTRSSNPEWTPVARACASLIEGLDVLSGPVAGRIAQEVEEYRELPIDEVTRSLTLIGTWALSGLAERRGPTENEMQLAFEWGRHRARSGQAVESVMRAFRVGYREWLSQLIPLIPARNKAVMLEAITVMWQWLDDISRTVTRGFAAEASSILARTAHARESLVDALRNGDVDTELTRASCEALGFDPSASFRVSWARGTVDLDALTASLGDLRGEAHAVVRGLDVIVVSQGMDVAQLERVMPAGPTGIGLERAGLEGAAASLTDAKLCLALCEAVGRSPVRFETEWLLATLYADRARLAPLLQRGVEAFRTMPHIGAAASTFTRASFSQSETARRLHLQPNSLNYRIRRWENVTGRELRDPSGVAYAILAAALAGSDGTAGSSAPS